jgi:hypothetical protein
MEPTKHPRHPGQTWRELGAQQQAQLRMLEGGPAPRLRKLEPRDLGIDEFLRDAGGLRDEVPLRRWHTLRTFVQKVCRSFVLAD